MRKIVIILFITLLALPSLAQRYKDVFPAIANASSDEEALSLIKTYMIEDLDHPNANLRLALIYEKRYKNADPLTQYDRAIANAEEAALRFIKAQAVVDDKDVRKNTGWYANFSTGMDSKGRAVVEFTDVQRKMKNGYDSAKIFIETIPPIYKAFTESVDYYDRAIKLFASINGEYTSLDKLLLLYDEELNQQLEQLKIYYDSSLYHLDNYLALTKAYPIKGYNQSYTIKPIKTYRLEGLLTSPNFLVNNIEIWNYKEWANTVQNSVSSDITNLRQTLEQAEIRLNKELKTIASRNYEAPYEPYRITKKLEFDLRKFDTESLPVALLKYKEFKQELLLKNNLVLDFDSTLSTGIQNVYYGELIYHSLDADSLIKTVNERIDEESIKKYPEYLKTYYSGTEGLKKFVSEEQSLSKSLLSKSVEGISVNILGQINAEKQEPEFYSYGRLKIPSKVTTLKHADSIGNDFITTQTIKSADGSKYIGGVVKSSKTPNPVKTFIIKTDQNNKVSWYHEYELLTDTKKSQTNLLGDLVLTPEGCAFTIHSYNQDSIVNHLLYLDEKGEEIFKQRLSTDKMPRLASYVENTSSFLLTFKGGSLTEDVKNKKEMLILSLNLIGDQLWSKTFDFAGNTIALINTSEGFSIVGNFSAVKNVKGQEIVTKINEGQTNAFVARFDPRGQILSVLTMKSGENYRINRVVKVNDSVINLLGYKDPSGKSVHLIVNQFNRLIYSSL